MKTLPLEKIWGGDGYASYPVTLKQIKRTDTVAMYQKFSNDGRPQGYEVFTIKVRLKGQALPGGLFEQEDREVYPGANSFGKTAENPYTIEQAEKIYEEMNKAPLTEEEEIEKSALNIPSTEFTVGELATFNNAVYSDAAVFVKSNVESGTIIFLRAERRAAKGKPSNIYAKK